MLRRSKDTLPAGYRSVYKVDLARDLDLMVRLNAAGLALMAGAGWLLLGYLQRARPGEFGLGAYLSLAGAAITLAALAMMVVLHEGVHGALFWLLTGKRPQVGIGSYYAYAGARGWFIPRLEYTVIGLAPLVVLSLLGTAALPYAASVWLPGIFLILVMNAGGSVGDLYIVYRVWQHGRGILVEDRGDGMEIYDREEIGDL